MLTYNLSVVDLEEGPNLCLSSTEVKFAIPSFGLENMGYFFGYIYGNISHLDGNNKFCDYIKELGENVHWKISLNIHT